MHRMLSWTLSTLGDGTITGWQLANDNYNGLGLGVIVGLLANTRSFYGPVHKDIIIIIIVVVVIIK